MLMPPAHNYLNNASCGYLGLGKKKEPYYIFVSFTWSLLKPTLCLCSILCIIEAIKSSKTELLQLSWIRNGLKTVFWIVAGGDLCAAPAGILHHSSLHNLILNNSVHRDSVWPMRLYNSAAVSFDRLNSVLENCCRWNWLYLEKEGKVNSSYLKWNRQIIFIWTLYQMHSFTHFIIH